MYKVPANKLIPIKVMILNTIFVLVILTFHSSTVTSHTDSVSSSPETPELSAAAEENPDSRPVVAPEAFQSSSAALPLPSKTHRIAVISLGAPLYAEMRQTHKLWENPTSF